MIIENGGSDRKAFILMNIAEDFQIVVFCNLFKPWQKSELKYKKIPKYQVFCLVFIYRI